MNEEIRLLYYYLLKLGWKITSKYGHKDGMMLVLSCPEKFNQFGGKLEMNSVIVEIGNLYENSR